MSEPVHLPIVDNFESSLAPDGRRKFVYPADVHGRFATWRRIVFAVLIGVWIALPLVKIGGKPLVLLDMTRRTFYLFGHTFNSQDVWLIFFLLTGVVFLLVVLTSLAGRVFCGFACPQTVFLDAIFRPIERFVEGPREKRIRRDKGPWTLEKLGRKALKHSLYLAAAFLVAHVVLSFFVPLPQTIRMVVGNPAKHPEAFAWATALTLVIYGDFAWFREQLCLVICPYGRLQASLVDDDSLVIGYDVKRGEPRGKVHEAGKGDCVDCKRCVVVCPTGIDIRNGLQLDCIGCTACVDACDEVMTKLDRPRGLVRYDSQRAFAGGKRKLWRPRLAVYAVLGVLGVAAATFAFSGRTSFEANISRARGAPFVVEGGRVRNSFLLHLVNKRDEAVTYQIAVENGPEVEVAVASSAEVPAMGNIAVPVVASCASDLPGQVEVVLRVSRPERGDERLVRTTLVRPNP